MSRKSNADSIPVLGACVVLGRGSGPHRRARTKLPLACRAAVSPGCPRLLNRVPGPLAQPGPGTPASVAAQPDRKSLSPWRRSPLGPSPRVVMAPPSGEGPPAEPSGEGPRAERHRQTVQCQVPGVCVIRDRVPRDRRGEERSRCNGPRWPSRRSSHELACALGQPATRALPRRKHRPRNRRNPRALPS